MAIAPAVLIVLWTGFATAAEIKLTVRVYNYAAVPGKTLAGAEATAQRVFHTAAIDTEWIGCPRNRDEENDYRACEKPAMPSDVILHIVPRSMEGYDVRHTAFGFALPSDAGRQGRLSYVFFSRVEEFVLQNRKVPLETLLAYVMVHEIAHLLLGAGAHSERGIMLPRWMRADLGEMARGALRFTPDHARELRARARERASMSAARH